MPCASSMVLAKVTLHGLCQQPILDTLILMAACQPVSQGIVQVPFERAGCVQWVQFANVIGYKITWLLVLTMEMELLYDDHQLWLKMLLVYRD